MDLSHLRSQRTAPHEESPPTLFFARFAGKFLVYDWSGYICWCSSTELAELISLESNGGAGTVRLLVTGHPPPREYRRPQAVGERAKEVSLDDLDL